MTKSRCVVIGGSGFIGQHVTERLIALGYPVTVCVRNPDPSFFKNIPKQFVKQVDITDPSSFTRVLKKDDIVFDFASPSVPFSSMKDPVNEIAEHILPHARLIETAMKRGIKKYIFTSSGGSVYGKKPASPVTEETLPAPISPYAISKITLEYFLNYYSNVYNVPYLIYRLSNPYGPGQRYRDGFGIIPTLLHHIETKKTPTLYNEGRSIRDFIYIDDVVKAIEVSFDKKNDFSVYNIGSGEGTTIKKLWSIIKKLTKTEIEPKLEPQRQIDVDKIVLSTERFQNEYNWMPEVTLAEGLRRCL